MESRQGMVYPGVSASQDLEETFKIKIFTSLASSEILLARLHSNHHQLSFKTQHTQKILDQIISKQPKSVCPRLLLAQKSVGNEPMLGLIKDYRP